MNEHDEQMDVYDFGFDMANEKARVFYNNEKRAFSVRDFFGGWVVRTSVGIVWYSSKWTPTEIFTDMPGDMKIL